MVRETSHDLRAQARETILELLELVSSDEELPTGPILASDEESDNEDEVSVQSTHDITAIPHINNDNNKRRLSVGKSNIDILTNNQSIFMSAQQIELNDSVTAPSTVTDMYGLMLPAGAQTRNHPTTNIGVIRQSLEDVATFDTVAENPHEHQDHISNPMLNELDDNNNDDSDIDQVNGTDNYTSDMIPLATKPMYKRRMIIPDSRTITSNGTRKSTSIGSIYDKTGLLSRTNKWSNRGIPSESSKKSGT
jgi:hypothetical protein